MECATVVREKPHRLQSEQHIFDIGTLHITPARRDYKSSHVLSAHKMVKGTRVRVESTNFSAYRFAINMENNTRIESIICIMNLPAIRVRSSYKDSLLIRWNQPDVNSITEVNTKAGEKKYWFDSNCISMFSDFFQPERRKTKYKLKLENQDYYSHHPFFFSFDRANSYSGNLIVTYTVKNDWLLDSLLCLYNGEKYSLRNLCEELELDYADIISVKKADQISLCYGISVYTKSETPTLSNLTTMVRFQKCDFVEVGKWNTIIGIGVLVGLFYRTDKEGLISLRVNKLPYCEEIPTSIHSTAISAFVQRTPKKTNNHLFLFSEVFRSPHQLCGMNLEDLIIEFKIANCDNLDCYSIVWSY